MLKSGWLLTCVVLGTSIWMTFGKTCVKVPGHVCTCKLENGTLISLDAISGSKSPVFADVEEVNHTSADGRQYLYYYDPCRSFALPQANGVCTGVSVCQKDVASNAYYNLGELGRHQGCDGQDCRRTNVSLRCDWSRGDPMLEVFRQNGGTPLEYNMTLTSRCACPAGCAEERHPTRLSGGAVFLIVLVAGAGFYLLVGVAYRRIVVGATGWEALPNRRFWASLPGLVRDGVTFCITCRRADTTYDQI
ncbi:uncharacterized protein LOC119097788 [Pollicipes pollicipes]|uniref:uncharacterized protein LOC119097788 n=1 Tax=Pollicipes pollicipes TaxID=41117 RepID=UPI0018855B65|nr:uncharacterized protein LOC119097788 [Pollicipes pollicipes]